MLKKFLMFALLLGVATTTVFADIVVKAEGKAQSYPDGSTLNVSAARDIAIDYYGVRCFIPKGQKLSLRCSGADQNNVVFCSGKNFKNIKIGNSTIVTDKEVSFSVAQDGSLNIDSGAMVVKDNKDGIAILEQGNTYKVETGLNLSDSVFPVKEDNQKYEQVQKDRVLSPSAPRN